MEQTKIEREWKTTLKGLRIPEGCNSRFVIKGHHKETAGDGGGDLGHAVSAQVFSLELCQTTQEQKKKLCLNFVPFQNGHVLFSLLPPEARKLKINLEHLIQ